MTHEPDAYGQSGCGQGTGDLALPGASDCGRAACRELRIKHKAEKVAELRKANATWSPSERYGNEAYARLVQAWCFGGPGHDPNPGTARFCPECVTKALATAFEAGVQNAPRRD